VSAPDSRLQTTEGESAQQRRATIAILDYGSQYTQLIARRVRESRVYCEIFPHDVTAKELDQAKTYALGVHAIRQQSGAAVIGEVADAYLFGRLAELEEFEARVRAVTAEEMRAVAQRYFVEERRVEGIVRGKPRSE